jgi:FkbM family methyltransferase
MADIVGIDRLNLTSLSQRLARLDHYWQAKFRNRFGPLVAKLGREIPPGGLILDVGANHGKFAKNFARLHNGQTTVWCFEPFAYNYTLLEKVVGSMRNVRIFRTALSDKPGTVELYVPFKRKSGRIVPGSAHLGVKEGAEILGTHTAPDVARVSIPTDTLDAIVAREKPASVDFIKVDVEGAEGLVFRGGRETLNRFKPGIYCEITPGHPENVGMTAEGVMSELLALGYTVWAFPETYAEPQQVSGLTAGVRDYLFRHPARKR